MANHYTTGNCHSDKKHNPDQIYCTECGAPRNSIVVRWNVDHHRWALDTDLAEEYPDVWGKAHTVRFCASGRCMQCEAMLAKTTREVEAAS
jgi:hypothetical protein